MTATLLPFARVAIRAIVIIPAGEPGEDRCRTVPGGWPIDQNVGELQGPLEIVRRRVLDHEHRNGLPISIHPECYRRANSPRAVGE